MLGHAKGMLRTRYDTLRTCYDMLRTCYDVVRTQQGQLLEPAALGAIELGENMARTR